MRNAGHRSIFGLLCRGHAVSSFAHRSKNWKRATPLDIKDRMDGSNVVQKQVPKHYIRNAVHTISDGVGTMHVVKRSGAAYPPPGLVRSPTNFLLDPSG